MWDDVMDFVALKLNTLTSWVSPPEGKVQRKVLVIQCHPVKTALNTQAADRVCKGLLKAGHEIRLRRLYCYDDNSVSFQLEDSSRLSVESYSTNINQHMLTDMSSTEKENYHDPDATLSREIDRVTLNNVPSDVKSAVRDLLWCNSIVFVYPTWWFNFPAALKGYFDRVFLPGIAFKVPTPGVPAPYIGGTGLIPQLTHINKVGVVTTFGASQPVVFFAGDNGRRFVSRGFRALCAPGCGMMWHGLYESTVCDDSKRIKFLEDLEEDYSRF